MLVALAVGVIASKSLPSFGVARLMVRHPGKATPFSLVIRTKERKADQWLYIEEVKHFPNRLLTSPIGRKVTISLPSNLKRYSQACAVIAPEVQPGTGFHVAFGLRSCANLPRTDS